MGTWGSFSSYGEDGPSKLVFDQRQQDSFLFMRDTSGFYSRLGRVIETPLEVRQEIQGPFPVAPVILGFLSIFKRSQASSPFEALNSMLISSSQRDVRPPVETRWESSAFSTFSTGDSDMPSCCDTKDKPAFKSLRGYPDLFRVRATWCTFHLRQKAQGPSHIPISYRSLFLSCEWKVGITLEVNKRNELSS